MSLTTQATTPTGRRAPRRAWRGDWLASVGRSYLPFIGGLSGADVASRNLYWCLRRQP
jgi:hypothetical protein